MNESEVAARTDELSVGKSEWLVNAGADRETRCLIN